VAEAIGVTTMAISQYESGDRVPRDEIKIKLAKFFKKSVEELFFNAK
jgi:DNA-binding XRE family transcriptional regulator